jgi:octaprenyl-diphosphate synthase
VSREKIRKTLTRNGSVEYAMGVPDRYAEQSRFALASLPDSESKRALLWVPDFIVARQGDLYGFSTTTLASLPCSATA